MDTQGREAFLNLAAKAFRDQRAAADGVYAHTQSCFVCRGVKSRWFGWFWDFLFECQTIKNLAFVARVAKADADDYRLSLENLADLEVPSLEWLDGLYALRDDRSETGI